MKVIIKNNGGIIVSAQSKKIGVEYDYHELLKNLSDFILNYEGNIEEFGFTNGILYSMDLFNSHNMGCSKELIEELDKNGINTKFLMVADEESDFVLNAGDTDALSADEYTVSLDLDNREAVFKNVIFRKKITEIKEDNPYLKSALDNVWVLSKEEDLDFVGVLQTESLMETLEGKEKVWISQVGTEKYLACAKTGDGKCTLF